MKKTVRNRTTVVLVPIKPHNATTSPITGGTLVISHARVRGAEGERHCRDRLRGCRRDEITRIFHRASDSPVWNVGAEDRKSASGTGRINEIIKGAPAKKEESGRGRRRKKLHSRLRMEEIHYGTITTSGRSGSIYQTEAPRVDEKSPERGAGEEGEKRNR